jgi:hypothetical protein
MSAIAVLALGLFTTACGETDEEFTLTDPPRGKVASVRDDSTLVSDTLVANRGGSAKVGVQVLDKTGAPVAGVRVLFAIPDSTSWRSVTTDANGRAQTTIVVDSIGAQTILPAGEAGRINLTSAFVDPKEWDGSGTAAPVALVTAPARYKRLAPMEIVTGGVQTIAAGAIAATIRVRLKDEFGKPVVNASVGATPLTSASDLSSLTTNFTAATSAGTSSQGEVLFQWAPGNRIGVNRLAIRVNTAVGYALGTSDTVVVVTQTVPADAQFIMYRKDTVGTGLPPAVVGICRRIPVGVVFRMPRPGQPGQFADLIGATNQITITRPAGTARCPNTSADITTSITDAAGLETHTITVGGNAGTTTVAGAMGGKNASVGIAGARFPSAFTFSDTIRVGLNVAQTQAVTVSVTDTVGNAMTSMALTTGTLGGSSPVAMTDDESVFWISATNYSTNTSGAFTVNGVRVTTVIEPGLKMFFVPTSTVTGVQLVRVPVKMTLPANATMVFAATPPTTVLAGGLWTVTVRSRTPSPVIAMAGMKVTATRTSGPATVAAQEQFASGVNGDAVFSYNFTVKGTYTFQFRSSYFPILSATVTVQ